MSELTAPGDPISLLDAIVRAYADGDGNRADLLFERALDADLPWNEVCAAVARGVSWRFRRRGDDHHA